MDFEEIKKRTKERERSIIFENPTNYTKHMANCAIQLSLPLNVLCCFVIGWYVLANYTVPRAFSKIVRFSIFLIYF